MRKVSCGSAHTAAIAEDGSLWVWGCGDGGRLGLGRDDKASKPSPVRVDELLHERMGDVSCGVSHTLAASAIVEETTGDGNDKMKVMTGGRLYVAGPANVLGRFCATWTRVQSLDTVRAAAAAAAVAGARAARGGSGMKLRPP